LDIRDTIIIVMPLLAGSEGNIQIGLELLFGIYHSIGHISETLTAADRQNKGLPVPLPV